MKSIINLLDLISDYNSLKSRNYSEKLYESAIQNNKKVLSYEEIKAIERKIINLKVTQINEQFKDSANYSEKILDNLQNARNKQYKNESLYNETPQLKKLLETISYDEAISKNIASYCKQLKNMDFPKKTLNDADLLKTIGKIIKLKTSSEEYKLIKPIIDSKITQIYKTKKLREEIPDRHSEETEFIKNQNLQTKNLARTKNNSVQNKTRSKTNLEERLNQTKIKTGEVIHSNKKEKKSLSENREKKSYEEIIATKPQPSGKKKESNTTIKNAKFRAEYEKRLAEYNAKKTVNQSKKPVTPKFEIALVKNKVKKSSKFKSYLNNLISKISIPKITIPQINIPKYDFSNLKSTMLKYKPQQLKLTLPNYKTNLKLSKKSIITMGTIGIIGISGILYAFNSTKTSTQINNSLESKNKIEQFSEEKKQKETIDSKVSKNKFESLNYFSVIPQKEEITTKEKVTIITDPFEKKKETKQKTTKQKAVIKKLAFSKNNPFRKTKAKTYFGKKR